MGWPGPLTHRQFLTWQEWFKLEWNRPSRSDWYTMQVAAEIDRFKQAFRKTPSNVTVENKLIPFEFRGPPPPKTAEERDLESRTIWLGIFGMNPDGSKIEPGQ